jgi:hypothetical protein
MNAPAPLKRAELSMTSTWSSRETTADKSQALFVKFG